MPFERENPRAQCYEAINQSRNLPVVPVLTLLVPCQKKRMFSANVLSERNYFCHVTFILEGVPIKEGILNSLYLHFSYHASYIPGKRKTTLSIYLKRMVPVFFFVTMTNFCHCFQNLSTFSFDDSSRIKYYLFSVALCPGFGQDRVNFHHNPGKGHSQVG